MAFPNTLFPLISFNTVVSDQEYRLFHSIDIKLIKTLIRRLGRNHFGAIINVVAFLLWLERSRLCVNAVYKLGNLYWPDFMVDMLANQVVALLEWLKNSTLDFEKRGDISMIMKLCDQQIGFVELHQRSLEIFQEMTKIVQEMRQRAFEHEFGVGFGQFSHFKGVNHFGVRSIPHPQELQTINNGKGLVVGPRAELHKMRSNQGQEMGRTSGAGSQTKHPGRRPISEHLLSVLLSGINVTEEETNVHYDDRTVFLTFSRGYPVNGHELWNYFTRYVYYPLLSNQITYILTKVWNAYG